MRATSFTQWTVLAALLIIVGGVTYYSANAESSEDGDAMPPQIPSVDVEVLAPDVMRIWNEFSGRLEAVDHVEIRPRVSGEIVAVQFKEGSVVEVGDPLFIIDPRPFEADVASAQASLQSARSQRDLAKVELERAQKLVKNGHISESVTDERRNAYKVAIANIESAKARLDQAELDLEYAHIKAPVSGRISRAEFTKGNLVEANLNAPVLTTIVSNKEIYAEFDVDEQTYLSTVRSMGQDEAMPVELRLAGDDAVIYHGHIHSFDNQLDIATGTIRARGIFENKDGVLIPGMYANVRLGSAAKQRLLLVSEKAIGTDQDKKYVYVVTPEGQVEYREIRIGRTINDKREVLFGLQAGEQVMVNSLQRVQPGMKVNPVDVTGAPQAREHDHTATLALQS